MPNAVEIENVSKIFSKNYKSSRVQLKKIFLENFIGCKDTTKLAKDEFYALKDLDLVIEKNERVAVLGPNGSGKSTLMKMLSGIYMPDVGEIRVDGKVSSILELSTGFKPELSGLENIYLKFAMMGRSKEEVDEIIEDVIELSELREFMDTPLKRYSSGMKSKLGFAIVTSITPEILILDEVFATGDKKFRKKSEERLKTLYENTTTILVSHSMGTVKKVATRVVVLNKGQKVFDGGVTEGIAFYDAMME